LRAGAEHADQEEDGDDRQVWNRSTPKLARPVGVPSRRPSDRSCMTMAVEDRARHMPRIVAAGAGFPNP
jgi:hypothetical protein